jgi:hypothetical protein
MSSFRAKYVKTQKSRPVQVYRPVRNSRTVPDRTGPDRTGPDRPFTVTGSISATYNRSKIKRTFIVLK